MGPGYLAYKQDVAIHLITAFSRQLDALYFVDQEHDYHCILRRMEPKELVEKITKMFLILAICVRSLCSNSINCNSHTPVIFSHRDEHIVVVCEIFSHSIMQMHLWQD